MASDMNAILEACVAAKVNDADVLRGSAHDQVSDELYDQVAGLVDSAVLHAVREEVGGW